MNLLMIIALLMVGLFVVIKLTERTSKERSMEQMQSMSRWLIPLVAISLVAQLIYMMVK
ncbi:hypothetical protein [Echinimonas agarilytica]|uniref:Uncharacterized protein n=1 Tax=Echinimonas agarilytica TaxID=1215918 RepID=A0AA41WBP0_9GAMM|nr:hypothetical protein [Echinimonas agarilytica]MCM2681393.1 hypothetical protein [Echinimonas agarilytica]